MEPLLKSAEQEEKKKKRRAGGGKTGEKWGGGRGGRKRRRMLWGIRRARLLLHNADTSHKHSSHKPGTVRAVSWQFPGVRRRAARWPAERQSHWAAAVCPAIRHGTTWPAPHHTTASLTLYTTLSAFPWLWPEHGMTFRQRSAPHRRNSLHDTISTICISHTIT